jgi:hypothetical protein
MTKSEKNKHQNYPLLSDEEFMTLVEQDFNQHGQPLDELAKQKAWTALQSRISGATAVEDLHQPAMAKKVSQRVSSLLSLAAAAVMVLALVPMLSSYQTTGPERSKGGGDFPLVNISAFTLQSNGEMQSVRGTQAPGKTVVFKVDMSRPYVIALAMAKDNGRPEVRYRAGVLQPGMGRLLQADGQVYGYQLESGDNALMFCAIAAENEHRLSQRIRLLTRIWADLPKASCVHIDSL